MDEKVKCSKCEGTGRVDRHYSEVHEGKTLIFYRLCPKCGGDGKLDWIENIVGKKLDNSYYHLYHSLEPSNKY